MTGCEGTISALSATHPNDCGTAKSKTGAVKGKKNYDKCDIEVKCDRGCEK